MEMLRLCIEKKLEKEHQKPRVIVEGNFRSLVYEMVQRELGKKG